MVDWYNCSDGQLRWGENGAAGVLFVTSSGQDKGLLYYLVHRSPEVHHGGTWGIPGGAIDPGETAAQAALREAVEEVGYAPEEWKVLREHVYAPCTDWSYTTVVVWVEKPIAFGLFNWETIGSGWFSYREITSLPLHPSFRETFSQVILGLHHEIPW